MTSNNDTPPLDPIRALRIVMECDYEYEGMTIERSEDYND